MSLYIDRKFAGQLSGRLSLFTPKSNNTFTFRCPFCLDSKKNKNKTRGYIYQKDNGLFFKCHNCSRSHTFGGFLKTIDPNLYREYCLERFTSGENGYSNYKKPNVADIFKTVKKFKKQTIPTTIKIPSIAELDSKHFAREYVEKFRMIPQSRLSDLYFAGDFKSFIEELIPNKYKNLKPSEPRLIIPFYNENHELTAIQGRALLTDGRYLTLKVDEDALKIFGLDKVDVTQKVYVVEGPIDSLFLPNCIAAAGSDLPTKFKNSVFVFDNQPRNIQVTTKVKKMIDSGYSVCIWPNIEGKDINEMIQLGYTADHVKDVIDKCTFKSLEAKMKFSQWSKV